MLLHSVFDRSSVSSVVELASSPVNPYSAYIVYWKDRRPLVQVGPHRYVETHLPTVQLVSLDPQGRPSFDPNIN
jgi:hypothetical protein